MYILSNAYYLVFSSVDLVSLVVKNYSCGQRGKQSDPYFSRVKLTPIIKASLYPVETKPSIVEVVVALPPHVLSI